MDVKGCLGSIFLQNSGVSHSSFSVGIVRRYADRPVGLGVISPISDLRIVLWMPSAATLLVGIWSVGVLASFWLGRLTLGLHVAPPHCPRLQNL